MKKTIFLLILCTSTAFALTVNPRKMVTLRGEAQYLSTQQTEVEDTCPGNDIFASFSCSSQQPNGFSCFDVYEVKGSPLPAQRYTLLDESVSTQNNTAEPACNFDGELTCQNFLESLKYNLDFSWFITNFPSSSFPQCAQTYSCTRIACWRTLPPTGTGEIQSKKLMCVYKKEQTFFVGSQITCQDKTHSTK